MQKPGTSDVEQKQSTGQVLQASDLPTSPTPNTLATESIISASQLDFGLKSEKDWAVIDVREPYEAGKHLYR